MPGVLRAGQRPAAPDHPPGPGGDAGRGAGPAAPGPGGAVHRGARGDPQGRRLSLVTFEGGQYSVPHELAGQAVWVRRHGEQVVITHAGPAGPAEVARHLVTTPGSPRVDDAHYPPAPPGALSRTPKAAHRGRGAVPGDRGRRRAVAGRGRRRGHRPDAGQDGHRGAAGRPARRRRGGPGARARPPRRAGSPTATWPPSSPTRPAPPAASRPGPASSPRWPRAPAGGPGTAGRRQPDDPAPRA